MSISHSNSPIAVILHHQAGNGSFESINRLHWEKWAFKSQLGYYCSYHYWISQKGEVIQARKENESGIHTPGYNNKSIAICLQGNFSIEPEPTEKQKNALRELLTGIFERYKINVSDVKYHRHISATQCPGNNIKDDFISNLFKMKHIILNGEQYLLYEPFKVAFSIGDEVELASLMDSGLKGNPIEIKEDDLKGYVVYPFVQKKRLKELLNFK